MSHILSVNLIFIDVVVQLRIADCILLKVYEFQVHQLQYMFEFLLL